MNSTRPPKGPAIDLQAPRVRGRAPLRYGGWLLAVMGVILVVLILLAIKWGHANIAIIIASVPILAVLVDRSPRSIIYFLIIWSVILGFIRRISDSYLSSGSLGDPLLLILPIVLVLLFVVAVQRGAFNHLTVLAKTVLFLSILAVVECVNPLQGGLTVGLGALIIIVAPMLAFWVGRLLIDQRTVYRALWLVATLALIAAIYGISQTVIGFTFWDQRWVNHVLSTNSYVAITVGGVTRGFGSFSSSQEYAVFLGFGLVIWCTLGRLGPGRAAGTLLAVGIIGWAIVIDSSRSILILSVIALGMIFAIRAGMGIKGVVLCAVAAFAVLTFAAGHLVSNGTSTNSVLLQHQFQGLASPFNPQVSTFGIHSSEFLSGVKSAFRVPFGHGTGSVTVAASHFAGNAQNTDIDPSNAGVAYGVVGLITYLLLLIRAFRATYTMVNSRRDPVSLAILGLLIVTLFQWLSGGLYSVNWLFWLFLGWIDGQQFALERNPAGVVELEVAGRFE
jgi:hypothetical protein